MSECPTFWASGEHRGCAGCQALLFRVQEDQEPELDKEFGDAGDDADIVDEQMWRGDESDDGGEEAKKDAGVSDKSTAEAGDASTRKLVAGQHDEEAAGDAQPSDAVCTCTSVMCFCVCVNDTTSSNEGIRSPGAHSCTEASALTCGSSSSTRGCHQEHATVGP